MANYDYTLGTAGSGLYKQVEKNAHVVRKHVVNFADVLATKGSALVATDTVDVMTLFPGEFLVGAYSRVITAGTAGSTVTVGDQASAAGFIASVAVDAAASTVLSGSGALLQSGLTPFSILGKFYSAANTVRLTLGATAPQAGVVEITVDVVQLGTDTAI